jgi:chaperonin GroES
MELPATEQAAPQGARAFIEQVNIAEHLKEAKLLEIAEEVHSGYKTDLQSREQWEKNLDEWTKLALQFKEEKSYPWPKASNIKYPLLSTASLQFNARAYPTLIPPQGNVVRVEIIGSDPQGLKAERADRVSKFMSYQLMKQMLNWDSDMDKALLILPIVGTLFKKTYWDSQKKQNCSTLIMPKDLVINYWARSLETCERKTEVIEMPKRVLKERQNAGIFLNIDLPSPTSQGTEANPNLQKTQPGKDDRTTPYIILEQHTFLDLDNDGYDEPYIITLEEASKKVLRICARFDEEGISTNEKGDITKIDPIEYYTKYTFIPNPDGGFYDVGFGLLLGPINDSVNTLVNQLVDSGTLSNLQAGFIGKGLRMKMGDAMFKPGEWKPVNATGDDIKKQIFPLPVNQPSKVLFELLGMLVQAVKELASVPEIFVGKMPGQNTPATTTMATIEQGQKVFTAVYKRVWRSLQSEFKKLYRLNRIYINPQEIVNILDQPVTPEDFDESKYDICPAADPAATSSQEKMAKAQALIELLQLGTVDPAAVTMRILQAQEQPKIEELLPKGPPPPDPKVVAEQQKAQTAQMMAQQKMQLEQQKAELKMRESAVQMQMEQQMQAMELQHKQAITQLELRVKMMEANVKTAATIQQAQVDKQVADQDMRVSQAQHEQKMKQAKEVKPKKENK